MRPAFSLARLDHGGPQACRMMESFGIVAGEEFADNSRQLEALCSIMFEESHVE